MSSTSFGKWNDNEQIESIGKELHALVLIISL
jgi:hypothetical protein